MIDRKFENKFTYFIIIIKWNGRLFFYTRNTFANNIEHWSTFIAFCSIAVCCFFLLQSLLLCSWNFYIMILLWASEQNEKFRHKIDLKCATFLLAHSIIRYLQLWNWLRLNTVILSCIVYFYRCSYYFFNLTIDHEYQHRNE